MSHQVGTAAAPPQRQRREATTTRSSRSAVRFIAALGIAVSITAVYLGLLSKFSFETITTTAATFNDKSIQVRAADTNLADISAENIRIIALCGGSTFFDDAFRKISEWLPIWYAGMYQRPEDVTIPQQSWCENKIEQWVVSELQRRQMANMSKTTSSIEVIYGDGDLFQRKSPLNTTLVGQSNEPPKWEGGMHTPSRPYFHFQRYINNWGEVAWSKGIRCSQDSSTIHVYRSRQLWTVAQEEDCAVVHLPAILPYVQGFLSHRIQNGLSPANETPLSLLSRRLTRDQARQSLSSKSNFCILITMTTFQPKYSTDALVRHALCRLLTKQYKPCAAFVSWKGQNTHNITIEAGFHKTQEAMKDFKFAITMPNHFQDGYIAEKTVNPYLASSVAITSIPNIGQYVNAEGMISCRIPDEELRKVQMYYKGNFKWMPFNTTPDMWKSEDEIMPIKYHPYANNKKGDEPVLEFATSQWEEALQPCIEEIIRVDQDDTAYIEKLMQPYLLNEGNNSMFDGTYVAMSMLRWFLWANSPLVRGLEDRINSLDGMLEQTPGWGEPPVKQFEDGVDYHLKTKNEEGVYRPVQQNTVQQGKAILGIPPHSHGGGNATICTFCDGGILNQDWVVPQTGGNTCGSIKLMAAGEVNGSDVCGTIQKEERVCCPDLEGGDASPPHSNLTAISIGACCGIGHRLTLNIASMVYAISNNRHVSVNWTDVEWNVLFQDTPQIKQGPKQKEHYANKHPKKWRDSPLAKTGPMQQPNVASSYDKYGESMKAIFDMPLAQSIVKSLSNNLSSRVLSFLDPMRNQYASKQGGLHLCAHIREGNNEDGDWKGKEWRHINLHLILNSTLAGMKDFVFSTGNSSATDKMKRMKPKVSVFVASDNEIARPWFESHVPNYWHVVKPGKYLQRPETGVWFGAFGSKTNQHLTKDQKDEAMAEAVADVFALGECDSLFIPNYSSFSTVGITLTRAERKKVFFLDTAGDTYLEMPVHTPPPIVSSGERCTFCEGGVPNLDLLVPGTGGNTCGSIKLMTAQEVNGSDVCAIIQKKERVCCQGPPPAKQQS